MALKRRTSRRHRAAKRPNRAHCNKLLEEESRRHGEPSLHPIRSLLLIIVLTVTGCFGMRTRDGSLMGCALVDGFTIFLLSVSLVSYFWAGGLQRWCKAHEKDLHALADHDSKFRDIGGINVHHKIEWGGGSCSTLIHMYHGFGANLWTWDRVQQKLARRTGAVVSAHDMPGFGLSDRPQSVPAYSLLHNGNIGRIIMELQVPGKILWTDVTHADCNPGLPCIPAKAHGLFSLPKDIFPAISKGLHGFRPHAGVKRTGSARILAHWGQSMLKSGSQSDLTDDSLQDSMAQKARRERILIGHSMGCASAALTAISDPEGISCLVLVAPAIPAIVFPGFGLSNNIPTIINQRHGAMLGVRCLGTHVRSLVSGLRACLHLAEGMAHRGMSLLGYTFGRLVRILLSLMFLFLSFLTFVCQLWLLGAARFVGRSSSFWNAALQTSFYQKNCIKSRIWAYRRPNYLQGWETSLIPFILSWLSMDGTGAVNDLIDALTNPAPRTLAQNLAEMVTKTGIKVVIIQGTDDPLIPRRHGRNLAAMIPGAQLVEYSECGHNPQEECPQRFLKDISNIANGKFSGF